MRLCPADEHPFSFDLASQPQLVMHLVPDVEAIKVEVGNLALSQMIVMLWKPDMKMDFAISVAMKIVPDVWADRQGHDAFLYIYLPRLRN